MTTKTKNTSINVTVLNPRPTALVPIFDTMPAELKPQKRWCVWKYEWSKNNWTKVPYQLNDHKGSSTNKKTWLSFEAVKAAYKCGGWDGVGVYMDHDIIGSDLDHFVDNNEIEQWGEEILKTLDSYAEYSPSGTGIRIFVKGLLPVTETKNGKDIRGGKNLRFPDKHGIEWYCEGRFLTVTGHHIENTPHTIEPRQEVHDLFRTEIIARYAQTKVTPKKVSSPSPASYVPTFLSDTELIQKATHAKNGAAFASLWNGHWDGCGSQSEADLALCNYLAFWTGKDATRMDRLFRQSGLYREEKWDRNARSGETYGEGTIRQAINNCNEIYNPYQQERIVQQSRAHLNGASEKAVQEDHSSVEEPMVIAVRRKIAEFVNDCPPFKQNPKVYNFYLSQILYELPLTDNGNAIRLSARFGHLFRYVFEQKEFYIWDGKRWEADRRGSTLSFARETAQYIEMEIDCLPYPRNEAGVAYKRPKEMSESELADLSATQKEKITALFAAYDSKRKAHHAWAKTSQAKSRLEAMMSIAASEQKQRGGLYDASLSITQFDRHDWLFNCPNGTLDLENAHQEIITFHEHNPDHLLTKMGGAEYHPEATCPAWQKDIQKKWPDDPGLVQFHQDLVGCGLVGRQLDDILVIAFGPGDNGKGVFAEVIKGVLGDYAGTAVADTFLQKPTEGIPNDKAKLNGVRFLTINETPEGRKLDEAGVKSLISGEPIAVRFLNREFFDMIPRFTPILFTNHKPVIKGTDDGIWRRIKAVPWMYKYTNDPHILCKADAIAQFASENSGILNWAIEGLKHRRQTPLIVVPSSVRDETQDYRDQSDYLREFLEEYCVVDEPDAKIDRAELYEKYKEYAKDIEMRKEDRIETPKVFYQKLRERKGNSIPYFKELKKTHGKYPFLGIRLKTEEEREADTEDDNVAINPAMWQVYSDFIQISQEMGYEVKTANGMVKPEAHWQEVTQLLDRRRRRFTAQAEALIRIALA